MADAPNENGCTARVAVYWDFENLVISEYNRVHNDPDDPHDNAWKRHRKLRQWREMKDRGEQAPVDIDALLSFAASRGMIVVNRIYADWTSEVVRDYNNKFARRCVEPVQQFSSLSGKNGADIRIAIDVVEDLRFDDTITDVVLFSGDVDFVSVAHHCLRLGKKIHAVGMQGQSAKLWRKSCNFHLYDEVVHTQTPIQELRREATRGIDTLQLLHDALRRFPPGQLVNRRFVEPVMRRLNWGFDVSATAFGDVDNLIEAATTDHLVLRSDDRRSVRLRDDPVQSPSQGEPAHAGVGATPAALPVPEAASGPAAPGAPATQETPPGAPATQETPPWGGGVGG